jgi:Carboxypeptidase regulatory-like domain
MNRTILLIIILILAIIKLSLAQKSTGDLEGRILDSEGAPIIHANIQLSSESMLGVRKTLTNKQGYFYAFGIPVGNYTIIISHISKQNVTFENIIVRLGKTTSLGEVMLKEEVSEIQEIVVHAGKPIVDVSSTSSGLSIKKSIFESLPIQRDYKSVLSLSPLATESYYGDGVNVSGSTGWENTYFIDGTNVTDPMRGSSGTKLSYNFIKEVEIKNGGYQAEYGKSLGAIANVITHQGGNKFHGQVFGFFTDQSFAGEYKMGTVIKQIKDFATYDFGISLGGPIIFDKLWYFTAYNPTFKDLDVEIPDVGVYKDRTRSHLFAGKLTWRLSTKTNLVLTLIGDPTTQERVENQLAPALPPIQTAENADPFLGNIKTGGYNLSLKAQHIFNNEFFMEVFLSGLSTYYNDFASTKYGRIEPFYMDFVNNFIAVSGGYGRFRENHSRRLTASVNVTYTLSSHIIKAGIAYEDNFVDDRTINKGGISGNYPNPIMYAQDSLWIGWWGDKDVRVHNRVPSIFLQDSWRVIKRFRINAGIRWDGQFLVGSNGKVAQKILNQWQPRLGLTYQPGEIGSQKIYGSYGRFYEQLPLIFISTYAADDINQKKYYFHDPRINPDDAFFIAPNSSGIQPEVANLEGQYYDEFILGFERRIGDEYKIGIQGVYRNLGEVVEDGEKEDGSKIMGNPGKGELDFLPKFTREYTALEITFQKPRGKFNFLASYILSKNYGNYPGVFDSDIIYPEANLGNLDLPIQLVNATGLLPNDRTHLFKIIGSYNFDFGLTTGTSFILQSGTPINEYGPVPPNDGSNIIFHAERGSAGRTPTLWDWNIRLSYDLVNLTKMFNRFRILIDVFHLFSRREAVLLGQHQYLSDDGEGNRYENPNYLEPTVYQSPMTIRLGFEVNF